MEYSTIRAFRKVFRRVERLNNSLTSGCCTAVTMSQCHTLLEIEEMNETTLVGLADNMKLDKSTVSRTIEGLVQQGLVERTPHPIDRRYVLLKLSCAGEEVCGQINKDADEIYFKAFQHIASDRWNIIIRSIEELGEAMLISSQAQDEKESCCR